MFDVYCPGHDRRVLLFPSDIEEIRNVHGVIEVHYRCFCGHRGIFYTGRTTRDEQVSRQHKVKDHVQSEIG